MEAAIEATQQPRGPRTVPAVQLPLLYSDADVAVFCKPSGLAVHRGWSPDPVNAMTLARGILGRHVFPVHRLDRATSGVLAFALGPESAAAMQVSFQQGEVFKWYWALVRGTPATSGVIDHPVPRSENGPRVPAVTRFRRLATVGRFSLVEAMPETGRLHQIRRHFKHAGHPLVGDVRYGQGDINRLFRSEHGLHRLALHAMQLSFPHPSTGDRVTVSSGLPSDLAGTFDRLGIPAFLWTNPTFSALGPEESDGAGGER